MYTVVILFCSVYSGVRKGAGGALGLITRKKNCSLVFSI